MCRVNFKLFSSFPPKVVSQKAAKPPAPDTRSASGNTQYGLTHASILLGQRVSPSGHRSRRCRPAPGPKVSPLDTDQRLPPLDSAQGIASPGPHYPCRCLSPFYPTRFLPLFSQRRFVPFGTLHAIHLWGHIPFGRSFCFQAAMLGDISIVAEKRPLSRISKR